MVLGLENIKGLDFLNEINLSGILKGVGNFALLLIIMAIVGGGFAFFLYHKKQKTLYDQMLHFFEEVSGQMIPTEDLNATELIVPGTDIKVFYVKSKDIYLPRGTKKMGKKSYWYAIRNNRELVNFVMKNLNKDMIEVGLDYDHTDMRYAYANLREIIKRNYRDKATKWWKEYANIIAVVVFVFVFTISFWFLIGKIGGILDKIPALLDRIIALEQATGVSSASGVVPG